MRAVSIGVPPRQAPFARLCAGYAVLKRYSFAPPPTSLALPRHPLVVLQAVHALRPLRLHSSQVLRALRTDAASARNGTEVVGKGTKAMHVIKQGRGYSGVESFRVMHKGVGLGLLANPRETSECDVGASSLSLLFVSPFSPLSLSSLSAISPRTLKSSARSLSSGRGEGGGGVGGGGERERGVGEGILGAVSSFWRNRVRVPASQMAWSDLGVSVGAGVWGGLLPIPGATTPAVFFLLFLFAQRVKVIIYPPFHTLLPSTLLSVSLSLYLSLSLSLYISNNKLL